MEYVIGLVLAIIAYYFYAFIIEPNMRETRDWKHNWQQYTICEQAINKILEAMVQHEESAENTLILLNVIVDTYNESLRGDTAEAMMAPHFEKPTYDTNRRRSDSEGQESEGQKPRRTARERMEGNTPPRTNTDSDSIEE